MVSIPLLEALHDVLTDSTRVRIPPDEVERNCLALVHRIKQQYTPDIVIAIATGGTVPGELISQGIGIPLLHIVVKRSITVGRMYNKDPFPLKFIMSVYHHYLFHTVKPTVQRELTENISGKKVLVVDDAFHTGATVDIAVAYLMRTGAQEVRVATLSFVSKRRPEFSQLPRGNYSYPWSKDFVKDSAG